MIKYGRYCRNCHNKRSKVGVKKYAELSPEEKKKRSIREKTRRAVKLGIIHKKPCEYCGSSRSQIHHPDYAKPMDVRWLCSTCHGKEHRLKNMSLSNTDWKSEYKRLLFAEMKVKYPEAYKAGGGDTWNLNIPSEKTANGLTRLIMRFLKLKGHYCNRINTQGQARTGKVLRYDPFTKKPVYSNELRWTKGQTTKGTPDIDAIIYGKAVKIEVKVGKDRMSDDQIKQQGAIEEAGGLYFVARDMQSFYDWYYLNFAA